MASFKLKFRPSVTQGQEGTLYFQVIHRRVVKMIYTDFHIRQDEWNDTTSFIRITGTPERQAFLQLTASNSAVEHQTTYGHHHGQGNSKGGIQHGRHRIGLQAVTALPDMVRFRPRHGRKKGKDRPAGNGQDLS